MTVQPRSTIGVVALSVRNDGRVLASTVPNLVRPLGSETMSMRVLRIAAATVVAIALGPAARAEQPIKIAYIETLSGPGAEVGQQQFQQLQYMVDSINAQGGALGRKFELVVYDDKMQPSDALISLKAMADQNIHFVVNFGPSNVAAALIDGVEKQNARNPDNPIVFLNTGAVATELTNDKCSFWHFRFDANAEQKALMLIRAITAETKKVYLLNQDYLFGQSVQRDASRFLAQYRPDVQIVGNELIPLQKIKDFSPYISKIKASGAEAVITGNWGPDMSLLIKAGTDAGLNVPYYTLYAHIGSGPTAIGPAGEGRVMTVEEFNDNAAEEAGDPALKQWVAKFRATHDFDLYRGGGTRIMLEFLKAAIEKASSTDAQKVAAVMEGMSGKDALGHEALMRADDHQLLFPYYLAIFSKEVKYDSQKTGLGWKLVKTYEGKDLALPTVCKMKRPGV